MRNIWRFCISIELCLALLALICIVMALGSFRLSGESAALINSMPLFDWLRETQAGISWWLWLTLVFIALLVLNTILCSSEALWNRWGRAGIMPLFAPQMMHAGFLLIVLAHLASAIGSSLRQVEVYEGALVEIPGIRPFGIAEISVSTTSSGMALAFSSSLVTDLKNPASRISVSPNKPWLVDGYGVYIKHADAYPYRRALLEIHREPGAGMALAGGILFTIGNILVLYLRSRGSESAQLVDV